MSADTLIIGGGPAGAAAAIGLARAGHAPTLIERSTGPHDKVCGDFLGPTALAALVELGIEVAALGAAPIGRVRLIARGGTVEALLPFPAYGLSRRILDETLLHRAVAAGAQVRRGETVRALDARLPARTVLLATGKHDLRGLGRPAHGHGAVGLKTYVALAQDQAEALDGTVEIILLADGYAGLQPVENGLAVACVMRRREAVRGGDQHRLLDDLTAASAHLRRRLGGAVPIGDRAVAVAGVPYGHLHAPARDDPPGLFRLGDQAAVIPSLAGEGVAIALRSADVAARCVREGIDAVSYHRRLRAALRRPMRVAMGVHRLACIPAAQPWLLRICQVWPAMIGFTATRTRC